VATTAGAATATLLGYIGRSFAASLSSRAAICCGELTCSSTAARSHGSLALAVAATQQRISDTEQLAIRVAVAFITSADAAVTVA
jgi:hypothetical protein